MTTKAITKQELFKLLGEPSTTTTTIGSMSIHLPHDPTTDKYIINYEIVEIESVKTVEP